MSLHIETGHRITDNVDILAAKGVRFVTDDGRTRFEVRIGQDGRSIEIKSVRLSLVACPNASNSLTIRTLPYDA
jgi:hypothetical protein